MLLPVQPLTCQQNTSSKSWLSFRDKMLRSQNKCQFKGASAIALIAVLYKSLPVRSRVLSWQGTVDCWCFPPRSRSLIRPTTGASPIGSSFPHSIRSILPPGGLSKYQSASAIFSADKPPKFPGPKDILDPNLRVPGLVRL